MELLSVNFLSARSGTSSHKNGVVTPELQAMTINRTVWFLEFVNPLAVIGVVLNMATKPNLAGYIFNIVAGIAIGTILSRFAHARATKAVALAI